MFKVHGAATALCGLLAHSCFMAVGSLHAVDEPIVFSRDIRPILASHCFQCHGPDEATRQADLRLDTEAGAKTALAVEAGVAKLISRVTTHDAQLVMPPPEAKKPLTEAQKELLARWVKADAPWGSHWAFEPLVRPEVPKVDAHPAASLRNPIDNFVQARLLRRGHVPSPEAARETLIRRVTLDLTGLPPTPAEIDAFTSDKSENAWETVVDRLLKSPAYGERMAWNWLDAARYADTNGYQGDNERTMWPWRDWVINAFNRNMPYDEFTVWQLAGDLLPQATHEQKLATGFCRNHMINGEGGRIAEENRVEYVMDMTETTGTLWLGLTLNCCRCHDHKFDPLTQRDYYQLSAFFNQTPVDGDGRSGQTPPVLEAPNDLQRQKLTEFEAQLATALKPLQQREQELDTTREAWEKEVLSKADNQVWQPLKPILMNAVHQTLTAQPDGSILATGKNPRNDTYTLTMKSSLPRIAALRLDALNDPSHTKGGLARSDSGNFVLTEIELSVQQPGEDQPLRVKIASAVATFEQGNLKVDQTFDGDPKTGWAVYAGKPIDRPHSAVFYLAEPIALQRDATIAIVLRHDSPHVSHNIGRFRVSASESSSAKLDDSEDALVEILKVPADQRTKEQRDKVMAAQRAADPTVTKLQKDREKLDKAIKELRDSIPKVMVMQDMPKARPTWILTRGIYSKHAEEVSANTPQHLPNLPDGVTTNRLALARWIVSDENPLTARVTVNRIWQQFFGIGLVKTMEDFGVQGEVPLQQDLLDWLAADFRDNGWDVKRLIRQIVTSHTYRQSSRLGYRPTEPTQATKAETNSNERGGVAYEEDPENRLLSRGPRFRMPSWMLRDQALAASGLLVGTVGGPPVKGYQPAGVWEEATFGNKKYVQDQGESLYRRSLYTFWRRIIAPTMFFDNATRQTCTVKSFRTNTPLHALLTLNDVTFVEAARALAERTLKEELPHDEARIDSIFRRLMARSAQDQERTILLAAISRSRSEFKADQEAAQKLLALGESKRDERLDPVEHAAWTSLTLAVMNLDEALTKE